MKKSDREIMEILEAFDATGCAHSAAALAGVDAKSVRRYVAKREAGEPVDEPAKRTKIIDAFVPKIEEMVDTSEGAVRADKAHERLVAMGFTGDERTTRRAVAAAKAAYADGQCASTEASTRSQRRRRAQPGPSTRGGTAGSAFPSTRHNHAQACSWSGGAPATGGKAESSTSRS